MTQTYTTNLDELVEQVKERQQQKLPERLEAVCQQLREVLRTVTGIPADVPLMIYGEQADPPLVKHAAKSVLAEVIRRKLRKEDIAAEPIHLVLVDDIFGSNSELFQQFLSRNKTEDLGKQTYRFAPVTDTYIEGFARWMGHDSEPIQARRAEKPTIGIFNIDQRQECEQRTLPFAVKRQCFSELEHAIVKRPELLTALLEYAPATGRHEKGVYVTWQQNEPKKADSGARRHFLHIEPHTCVLVDRNNAPILEGQLADVLADRRCLAVALNAASRAVMAYLLNNEAVNITGGGSTYNEQMAIAFQENGGHQPLLAYVSNPHFHERHNTPMTCLKRTAVEEVLRAEIHDTSDRIWSELVR
ncbi:hypothetical protein HY490_00300 [Candidatus Woesearchaeota archaeon]|nr:hypothetical protein [Candidatus Woesearchaeota archaeon]